MTGREGKRGTHKTSAHTMATTTITAIPAGPATSVLFLSFQHVVLSIRLPSFEHPEISTGTVKAALWAAFVPMAASHMIVRKKSRESTAKML